jgi:lactoylglutathione lyase
MPFCHVTLAVKDLEASLRFYQDIVKLNLNKRLSAGADVEIAFLGDSAEIELIYGSKGICRDEESKGNGISIGFMTESLEDTIALLREKGYETNGEIISPNPSTSFFFAKDPDGYTVQFMKHS